MFKVSPISHEHLCRAWVGEYDYVDKLGKSFRGEATPPTYCAMLEKPHMSWKAWYEFVCAFCLN